MDKNRPLPPHTDFEEYRGQYFIRRKKARFPKPMFLAYFDTPNARGKQQER